MQCLIRYITKRSRSGVTYDDTAYDTNLLTIGRASDQQVHLTDLRVALQHAQIALGPTSALVSAQSQSGVWVNSQPVQTARLSVGDVVAIGNNHLEVIEPPEGYEFALEVEPTPPGQDDENMLAKNSQMGLDATKLTKRSWSWGLFLVIVVVFVGLPAAGTFDPNTREVLRKLPLGNDRAWDTGKLANTHQFIGNDCSKCHQKPFVQVEDQACAACHSNTSHHVALETFDMAKNRETTCGSCHHEHNEPTTLVRKDEGLCKDCHEQLTELLPSTGLINASDFEADHPEFNVTVTNWKNGKLAPQRVSLGEPERLREKSGIKFPHKNHLKPEGIKTHKGRVIMGCGDCHRPEPGGAAMIPIKMETMCKECHQLTFEPKDETRQVPHGNVPAVGYSLREYYAARALEGGYDEPSAPSVVRERRRPGRRLTKQERLDAQAWAEAKAFAVAQQAFEFTTCASCHDVKKTGEAEFPWRVEPVHIAYRWMPKAQFSHLKHRAQACTSCHRVEDSELSSDVAMPRIGSCYECHGGKSARDKLASGCVDCHDFHIAEDVAMIETEKNKRD